MLQRSGEAWHEEKRPEQAVASLPPRPDTSLAASVPRRTQRARGSTEPYRRRLRSALVFDVFAVLAGDVIIFRFVIVVENPKSVSFAPLVVSFILLLPVIVPKHRKPVSVAATRVNDGMPILSIDEAIGGHNL